MTCIAALLGRGWMGRPLVIAVPYVWLGLFFLAPFAIMFYISWVDMGNDILPFKPLWDEASGVLRLRFDNYTSLWRSDQGQWFDTLYVDAYLRSVWYAALSACICLLVGYPFAYAMTRADARWRPLLLLMVMLPFWTSLLLRVYAWKGLLADQGIVNQALLALGWVQTAPVLLYTDVSLLVGMAYVYLPFMVLPLYAALSKQNPQWLEAAYDLGCTPWRAFWIVTVPLSWRGIGAGMILVFVPSLGEFVIPSLLGGPENLMIGRVLWDEMFTANNWPRASALATVLVLAIVVPLVWYARVAAKDDRG